MKKILVAEDDYETNCAICEYLKEIKYITLSTYDGEETINYFFNNSFDLLLLDIMLPKLSGINVLHKIRESGSKVPIIIITSLNDDATQIESFNELADDYITKPFSLIVLGKRIEALLRRINNNDIEHLSFGDYVVDFSGYSAFYKDIKINVTPKEIQLLHYLVNHPGRVFTRDQLLTALWNDNFGVTDRIIDVYIKNLRKKLSVNIVTVKGIGYKYEVKK